MSDVVMPDAEIDHLPDSALLDAAQEGHPGAFGVLVRRHSDWAFRAAVRYGGGLADPDDLAAEVFVRLWLVLRHGFGPTSSLRSYLVVLMRTLAIRRWFQENYATQPAKPARRCWKYQLVSAAFHGLPEQWREVLWALDVEGVTPAELMTQLRISANTATALAIRARNELRKAYLNSAVPEAHEPDCRSTRELLVAFVRGDHSTRRATLFTTHLDGCEPCRGVVGGLVETSCEFALTGSIVRWLAGHRVTYDLIDQWEFQ